MQRELNSSQARLKDRKTICAPPLSGGAWVAVALMLQLADVTADCVELNYCNGHGSCNTQTSTCNCYNGYGSVTDIATYKAPDCSARTCPSGAAWVDIPTGAYAAHNLAECSNMGLCDTTTGLCRCFAGYEGVACQRSACPGYPLICSGHGRCLSMSQTSNEPNALPFSGEYGYGESNSARTWDRDKIFGCVCDSGWEVGYDAGQTQAPEYFGADCSKQRCPSNDNPTTLAVNEQDCEYYDQNGAVWRGYIGSDGNHYVSPVDAPLGVTLAPLAADSHKADALLPGQIANAGAAGNLCQQDCSNLGVCDYSSGTCSCFTGWGGTDCFTPISMYVNN